MSAWELWLGLAVILAVAEVLTLTLVLAMVAGGAAAAAVAAGLGLGSVGPEVVFVAVSGLLLATVLPAARRHRQLPPLLRSGTDALVGTHGTTLTQVDRHAGRVRLGGEDWSARPYDEDLVIPAGTDVDVFAIDGATAVVHPAHPAVNGAPT